MKKYTVKNYRGNLLESLSNFNKKYPGMRIVEAVENGDGLDITAEGGLFKLGPNPVMTLRVVDGSAIGNTYKLPAGKGRIGFKDSDDIKLPKDPRMALQYYEYNVDPRGTSIELSDGKGHKEVYHSGDRFRFAHSVFEIFGSLAESSNPGDTEQSEKNWAEVRALSAKLPEALAILHNYVYKCNDAVAFDASRGMNNASSNIGDIREQMKAVQRLESEFDEYVDNDLM